MSASITVTLPNGKTVSHDFTGSKSSINDAPDSFWETVVNTAKLKGDGFCFGIESLAYNEDTPPHTYVKSGKVRIGRAVQTDSGIYSYAAGPSILCGVSIVKVHNCEGCNSCR